MTDHKEEPSDLRSLAEATLDAESTDALEVSAMSAEEIRQVIHELRVHQIELEMQNEELRTAQIALEDSRSRYQDLYDYAPVGYVTLNDQGLLLEANLTTVRILGVERQRLTKMFFSQFV
jgi:PAS domain-containing protein